MAEFGSILKTESRIPGGFQNAQLLGHSKLNEDETMALISFLPPPFKVTAKKKNFIKNTFVVFVDEKKFAGKEVKYDWNIKLFNDKGEEVYILTDNPKTDRPAVFYLEIHSDEKLDLTQVSWCEVSVVISINGSVNTKETLELSFDVQAIDDDFFHDDSLNSSGIVSIGSEETTKILMLDYKPYLDRAGDWWEGQDQKIPTKNLVAGIAYLNQFKILNQEIDNPHLADLINKGIDLQESKDEARFWPFGLCPLKPHFLAMMLKPIGNDPETETYSYFIGIHEKNEKVIFDNYCLLGEYMTDLYNIIRFPKANIHSCGYILNFLAKELKITDNINSDNYTEQKSTIADLLTHFEKGYYKNKNY